MSVSPPVAPAGPRPPATHTERLGTRSTSSRAAAALFGLALPLLLAELLLRVAGQEVGAPRLPLSYDLGSVDQVASGRAQLSYRPDVGWLPTPDFDRTIEDVRYQYNHAGLRADREYAPTPPPGVRRILAYGDSFTHCDDANLKDCWTARLEAAMPDTEVLNLGVPGYSSDQSWMRYRHDGAAWRPCAVLIGHMVENINRVVNRFRPFYYTERSFALPKPRFVLENGRAVLLPDPVRHLDDLKDPAWVEANLGPYDSWYFPGMFVANPLDRFELVRLARTAVYRRSREDSKDWSPGWAEQIYRPETEAFEVLVAVLSEFASQIRADGASPVVVILPIKAETVAYRDAGTKTHAALLEALRQRGIPTIDLTDAFGQAARRTSPGNLILGHYRPQGNALVARTLANELPALTSSTCGTG